MTPEQMLRRIGGRSEPPPTNVPSPGTDHVDHVIRILETPANQGFRFERSKGEPWILELIDKQICPICENHLLHMQSIYAPETHFFTCEEQPRQHRWTIIEDVGDFK